MKKLIITIILLIVTGAVSFYSGIKYQEGKQRSFFRGRFGGQGQLPNTRQGLRPIRGEIIEISDDSFTVKLPDNSTKIVFFNNDTNINKAEKGKKEDLKKGEQVMVLGKENSDGTITASDIQLNFGFLRQRQP